MTAAGTIAAAITVLEADLHDGAWVYHPMSISENGVLVAANVMPPDGERIIRWQRTLKAQLAILKDARFRLVALPRIQFDLTLGLARSIIGEAS